MPRVYLPAEEMIRLVEPVLDSEFPALPPDIRRDLLAGIPHRAGKKEAPYLKDMVFLEPQPRLALWIDATRELTHELMAHVASRN